MVADLQNRINILIYACIILDRSASRSTHMDQRNCLLENIHQEIYTKLGVRETVNRQLWIQVLLWQCSWQLCVNVAFVLTPKSAVKSSRQTRRMFSAITNSLTITSDWRLATLLFCRKKKQGRTRYLINKSLYILDGQYFFASGNEITLSVRPSACPQTNQSL